MSRATDWALLRVVPPVAYAYLRILRASMRVSFRGKEVLDEARREPGRYILAFWHSRFLLMPFGYPGRKLVVLSSTHRDSEVLAGVLRKFGLALAKGSTTRGGIHGLKELVRKTREGYDAGFTPDGPRGPRRRVQPGVIAAARLSGLPIIPVAYSAFPARRMRSWDHLLVPRFFSRGLFDYGSPIRVPRDAGDDDQERFRKILEEELDRLTDSLDLETGIGLEEPRPSENQP